MGRTGLGVGPLTSDAASPQHFDRRLIVGVMTTQGSMEWDREAATFDEQPDHGLRDPAVRQAWELLLLPFLGERTLSIVDLGCGTGTLTFLLAQAGHQVFGVDFSFKMLEVARAKANALQLPAAFAQGDVADPPVTPACVDVVVSRHVLWAMPDPSAALLAWTRLLKPAGLLLLVEGRWSSGVGLTDAQCRALVLEHREEAEITRLNSAALWGHPITDQRYLVISRR